ELEVLLARRRIVHRRLPGSLALHSPTMEPAVPALGALLREIELRPPRLPYVSNVTGAWVTAEEATSPAHWCRQLCETVRFAVGLEALERESSTVLLEVGPGHGLAALARQRAGGVPGRRETGEQEERVVLASLPPAYEAQDDAAFLLTTLGKLWLAGVAIDWPGGHAGERRRKLPLPTYPFQRQRFGLDLLAGGARSAPRRPPPASPAPGIDTPPPKASRPGLRNPFVAPRQPLETVIAALWADLLKVERVGLHDSFFELGGHSLLAPQLLARLRERLAVDLPLAMLLSRPTVAATAAAVEHFRAHGTWDQLHEAPPDLHAEAVLDPAIRAQPVDDPGAPADDPCEVLLTGASGFLGAFLLRELLARTRARVHCLVRAESPAAAAARIRANLEARRLWDGSLAPRIVAVPGDLSEPRWGLGEQAFRDLAGQVEAVYHCGAWVNFTYPYRALAPANVLGTQEALRLAAAVRPKPFHFISTLAVFAPSSFDAAGVGLEDAGLHAPEGLVTGYAQSKWVAEKLIGIARRRGLRAAIYRPGVIGGDSRTGIGSTRDLVWNFLKACVQLAAAPAMEGPFDPLPVDYLSRAIVELSLRGENLDQAFHLFNLRSLPWSEVFATARSFGYDLAALPLPDWRQRLATVLAGTSENALRPFWPLLRDAGRGEAEHALASRFKFDCRNTCQGLGSRLPACPAVERLLERYLTQLGASGFLPAPATSDRALAAAVDRLPGDER
ncbi:MAG TPA: thioester reductase domain-containing protein, partial [Thermoanaerobaculia bacterium]